MHGVIRVCCIVSNTNMCLSLVHGCGENEASFYTRIFQGKITLIPQLKLL